MLSVTKTKRNNNKLSLSVVMFTYNHVFYIRQALDSVFNQTTLPVSELIIYDDCSCDGTSKIIEEYIQNRENVTYIRAKKNLLSRGVNVTWIPFQYVSSDICAYLDGDDAWISSDKNELQLIEILGNKCCGLVTCGWVENDIQGIEINKSNESAERIEYIMPFNKIMVNEFLTIQSSSAMFKMKSIKPLINNLRLTPPAGDLHIHTVCAYNHNVVSLGFYGTLRNRSKGSNRYHKDLKKSYNFARRNWDFRMRLIKNNIGLFSKSEILSAIYKYFYIYLRGSVTFGWTVHPEHFRVSDKIGKFYQFIISILIIVVYIFQIINRVRFNDNKN